MQWQIQTLFDALINSDNDCTSHFYVFVETIVNFPNMLTYLSHAMADPDILLLT